MSMLVIARADKSVRTEVPLGDYSILTPQLIKIKGNLKDIESAERVGQDLVLTFKSGKKITLYGFYNENEDGEHSELILEDDDALYWLNGEGDFVEIDMDALLANEVSDANTPPLWILGLVGGGLGVVLATESSSDSGRNTTNAGEQKNSNSKGSLSESPSTSESQVESEGVNQGGQEGGGQGGQEGDGQKGPSFAGIMPLPIPIFPEDMPEDEEGFREVFEGTVGTEEDTELNISWDDLVGADGNGDSIIFNGAAGGGQLLLNGEVVKEGTTLTKEQVEEGQLTFVPGLNEAGFDGYATEGVGDQKSSYAELDYTIQKEADGTLYSKSGKLTIEVTPVVDAPEVGITVTPKDQGNSDNGEQLTKVNGGSQNPDGTGFDVINGKIVAIGKNVRIWYTDAKTGSTQNNNVKEIQDLSDADIDAIIANSLKGLDPNSSEYAEKFAQMKSDNFKSYTQGNTHGDGDKTDIFILHEGSLYQQNVQTDNQGTTYSSYPINAVNGNAQGKPDFIFLLESDGVKYKVQGVVSHEEHESNYNHNDNWNITADGKHIVSGSNQLAGTITSSGGYIGQPGLVEKVEASAEMDEYDVNIIAHVTDLDGSESMLQDLVLKGLPEGAEVIHDGKSYVIGDSGQLTITGQFSNYSGAAASSTETQVNADIVIRVPKDTEFTLEVEAKAYEHVLGSDKTESGNGQYEFGTDNKDENSDVEVPVDNDDVVTNEPLQVKNADNNMLFKVFSSGEEDIEQLSINQKGTVDLNDVESFEPLKEQGSTETLVLDDLIADDESKKVPSFEDSDKDLDPSLIAETKDTDLNIETYDVQPVVDPLDDLLDQKMTLV